jgi:hypothetical protein
MKKSNDIYINIKLIKNIPYNISYIYLKINVKKLSSIAK